MMKYIGIILVSCSVSMYGAVMANKIKNIGKQRRAIIELLYTIRNSIEFGCVSLDKTFSSFHNDVLDKCGFTKILSSPYPDALSRAFESDCIILPENERLLLQAFAKECGKSAFSQNETKLCTRYINLMERNETEMLKIEKNKSALYSKLGILCGLLTAIILI